ncbi:MAG: hypothetical protein V7K77_27600 [Nostoc sp.]|uniref:hypothetical protein n=1 Tax=Nostoc sp. TaxID=1180 RepID=UPI002FFA77C5
MNDALRNSLWNVLSANLFLEYSNSIYKGIIRYSGKLIDVFIEYLWVKYFNKKGRGQEAEGRREYWLLLSARDQREQGFKSPTKIFSFRDAPRTI